MVKATFTLADGTIVELDGTPEDIQQVLKEHSLAQSSIGGTPKTSSDQKNDNQAIDISAIVNKIKSCDETDAIYSIILAKSSRLERILLPLFIVHKYFNEDSYLDANDISIILKKLGIKIEVPNIYKVLRQKENTKFILREDGDKATFRLSLYGKKHVEETLNQD